MILDNVALEGLLPQYILPYSPDHLENASYELTLGNEYFTTASEDGVKVKLKTDEQFSIKPGQFALLITKEVVTIPNNIVALISIKASIKFCGLVNVSGFHVDPGFVGKLKFAVYNAGSRDITLSEGQRLFPMWFCELTAPLNSEDKYDGTHYGQDSISSKDVQRLHGVIISPNVLNDKLKEVEQKINTASTIRTILLTVVLGFVGLSIGRYADNRANNASFQVIEKQMKLEESVNGVSEALKTQSMLVSNTQERLNLLEKESQQRASNVRSKNNEQSNRSANGQ
jgi:dCTP deaminase